MEPKLNLDDLTWATEDTITLSSPSDTITLSSPGGYTFANTITSGGYTVPNMPNVTISSGTGYTSPWVATTTAAPYLGNGISTDPTGSGKLKLNGEGADIEVNGESLIGMIKKIEERLNILHPNEKLEAEWEELRELGKKYKELEQHIKDKQATWDRLKAMPAPDIE